MGKGSRKRGKAHIINFLFSKKKSEFRDVFKAFPVIDMYERPIDKEVMCMIYAVVNDSLNSAKALSRIVSLFYPIKPHDWIISETFMHSFASLNLNSTIANDIKFYQVLPKLITLRAIYQTFDTMEDYCIYFHPKHPQQSLYEGLYTRRNDDNYAHPGIAMALMWLIRKNSDYSFGLWQRYNQKDLVAPLLGVIERRIYAEKLVSKKEEKPELALTKYLHTIDSNDPLKYIPLLAMDSWDNLLFEMGYVRS